MGFRQPREYLFAVCGVKHHKIVMLYTTQMSMQGFAASAKQGLSSVATEKSCPDHSAE
jgi:hypothetical protein